MDKDIELMLQVKEDNVAAFEQLYRKYQKPIGSFFFRLGCDPDTSEDYTQEVFLRIWRARKNYRPLTKLTTFLFQIAKNYWLNERDKKRRRPTTHLNDVIEQSDHKNSFTDKASQPVDEVLSEELNGKIQGAINDLGSKYRLVFVLSEIGDMKYKDIAEILDIPIGTVKSRMYIAERKLRKKLAKYLDHKGSIEEFNPEAIREE